MLREPSPSPTNYEPIQRILNNAIALHLQAGKPASDLPFGRILGRTADTTHAAAGCRVLLGNSYEDGAYVFDRCHGGNADDDVGLPPGI